MIINQNILFKDILKSAKLFYQKLYTKQTSTAATSC